MLLIMLLAPPPPPIGIWIVPTPGIETGYRMQLPLHLDDSSHRNNVALPLSAPVRLSMLCFSVSACGMTASPLWTTARPVLAMVPPSSCEGRRNALWVVTFQSFVTSNRSNAAQSSLFG